MAPRPLSLAGFRSSAEYRRSLVKPAPTPARSASRVCPALRGLVAPASPLRRHGSPFLADLVALRLESAPSLHASPPRPTRDGLAAASARTMPNSQPKRTPPFFPPVRPLEVLGPGQQTRRATSPFSNSGAMPRPSAAADGSVAECLRRLRPAGSSGRASGSPAGRASAGADEILGECLLQGLQFASGVHASGTPSQRACGAGPGGQRLPDGSGLHAQRPGGPVGTGCASRWMAARVPALPLVQDENHLGEAKHPGPISVSPARREVELFHVRGQHRRREVARRSGRAGGGLVTSLATGAAVRRDASAGPPTAPRPRGQVRRGIPDPEPGGAPLPTAPRRMQGCGQTSPVPGGNSVVAPCAERNRRHGRLASCSGSISCRPGRASAARAGTTAPSASGNHRRPAMDVVHQEDAVAQRRR